MSPSPLPLPVRRKEVIQSVFLRLPYLLLFRLKQFSQVKTVDNKLLVHAKHEESRGGLQPIKNSLCTSILCRGSLILRLILPPLMSDTPVAGMVSPCHNFFGLISVVFTYCNHITQGNRSTESTTGSFCFPQVGNTKKKEFKILWKKDIPCMLKQL